MTKKPAASRPAKKKPGKKAPRAVTLRHTSRENDDTRRPANPFLVVGVGASAGGMDAFITMLRNLPADIHAAFVFICHLDPRHESALEAIFQRETKLPVSSVTDPIAVKPGHIYVLPQNKQLRLSGGVLRPEPRRNQNGSHRPIDVFFSSLAADQGNSAVAIL